MEFSTADLCDKYRSSVQVLATPLKSYGGVNSFSGKIVTIELNRNNHDLVRILRDEKGEDRVAVVDVRKDFYAVVGDTLMGFAYKNGWAGIVINGYVRDTSITKSIPVGLLAVGTCPRKSFEINRARRGVDLEFGGVTFRDGEYIYIDEDGVVISKDILK